MSKTKNVSLTFPWAAILTVIFVTLKLAEVGVVATWSWWWVLSPLWITFGVVLAVILFAVIVMGLARLFK